MKNTNKNSNFRERKISNGRVTSIEKKSFNISRRISTLQKSIDAIKSSINAASVEHDKIVLNMRLENAVAKLEILTGTLSLMAKKHTSYISKNSKLARRNLSRR